MLSVDEVAAKLFISAKSVRLMIHKGELPAYQFGRLYRIRAEDVDEFMSSRKVQISA